MFNDIAENADDFKTFYEQFGKSIKLGCVAACAAAADADDDARADSACACCC